MRSNLYANLAQLKSRIGVSTTDYDSDLLDVLNAASRLIEKPVNTNRTYYAYEGTRYFDGQPDPAIVDDILSVSNAYLDQDGDGTYEVTLATTDYVLAPYNTYPKTRIKATNSGDYPGFADGVIQGLKVTGVFGYGDGQSATPWYSSGKVTAASVTAGDANISVATTATSSFSPGDTIRMTNTASSSEQLFVTAVGTNSLSVDRAKNGTIATTHTSGEAISICDYPEEITNAVLITSMRAWKRKDSAYQDNVGMAELGVIVSSKGLDPDVKETIREFELRRF